MSDQTDVQAFEKLAASLRKSADGMTKAEWDILKPAVHYAMANGMSARQVRDFLSAQGLDMGVSTVFSMNRDHQAELDKQALEGNSDD